MKTYTPLDSGSSHETWGSIGPLSGHGSWPRALTVGGLLLLVSVFGACTSDDAGEEGAAPRHVAVTETSAAPPPSESPQKATPPSAPTTQRVNEDAPAREARAVMEEEAALPSGEGAVDASAEEVVAEEAPSDGYDVSGSISLSYRARIRGGRNDEDLYGYLSLTGGTSGVDDVRFHIFGRGTLDLDGDENRSNLFTSLNDIGRDPLNLKLYEAYVSLEGEATPSSLGIRRIQIGRQNVVARFSYLVDGARIEFEPVQGLGNMRVAVFGGVPEYLYESNRSGDWLVGADIRFRPFSRTDVSLRYTHIEDGDSFVDGGSLQDDYGSVTIRQGFSDNVSLSATWNSLDGDTRDATLRLDWNVPEADLSIRASYRFQNDIEKEFTTVFDSYVGVLGDSFAYGQFNLEISKLLSENFAVDGGFTVRQLIDDAKDSPFNREFFRGWLTLSSIKWPTDCLSLSLTGEYWDGDNDKTASAGFETVWRPCDPLRFTVGSYYSLYKYDLFTVDERQDATTLYLKIRWKLPEDLRFDGRYEYETGDEGTFHSVLLGLTWSF